MTGTRAAVRGAYRARRGIALVCAGIGVGLSASLSTVSPAFAHDTDQNADVGANAPANPLRGSTLTFEQSVTTQTAEVGGAPQSYVPLYELWFSLRPVYWFDDHWSVRGRFDYSKELTNDQETTYYREDVFDDVWTDLAYQTPLDGLWKGTTAALAARALWPLSKASQAEGTYVRLGATGKLAHKFELRGDNAPAWNSLQVRLGAWYEHPFTHATTPTDYGNFAYTREDVDGASFISDEIQGETITDHRLVASVGATLKATPKLTVDATLFVVDKWRYAPTSGCVQIVTGCVQPSGASATTEQSASGEQFEQDTWFLFNVDYALFKELDVGVGYYNLANVIAPDGVRRSVFGSDNIWWSPDARFFFDITANLDAIVDDVQGRSRPTVEMGQTSALAPTRAK